MVRAVASLLVASALALALTGAAWADHWQIRFSAADQRLAAAATLGQRDLGRGWQGGRTEPDLTNVACPGFEPKQSDLVVTGAADSRFENGDSVLDAQIVVLRNARMVALDWRRSVLAPGWLGCLRHILSDGARVISVRKVALPRVATHAAAYRGVVDVKSATGATVRWVVDLIVMGQGRGEVSMTGLAPAGSPPLWKTELRLARLVAKRLGG